MSKLPAADGLVGPAGVLTALLERQRSAQAEHDRRMREEPAYRAEQDRLQAERRAAEEEEKRWREQERRERLTAAREAKGIPTRFWPFLDRWRAPVNAQPPASVAKAHAWVQRFLAGVPGWTFLVLAGPPGTGKTAAASWFLDAPVSRVWRHPVGQRDGVVEWREETVLEEAHGGALLTAGELARASSFDAQFWSSLAEADRLVVDDLGCEPLDGKGWALSNMLDLLTRRHAGQVLTLITTNLSRSAFEQRYLAADGGRLRDRFAESAIFAEITGPSLRRPLVVEEP